MVSDSQTTPKLAKAGLNAFLLWPAAGGRSLQGCYDQTWHDATAWLLSFWRIITDCCGSGRLHLPVLSKPSCDHSSSHHGHLYSRKSAILKALD
jgi:hypothetical protein